MTRGPGRPPILPPPPPGYAPLTDEELVEYSQNKVHFMDRRKRAGWLLALAERHRLVPIRSSGHSRNSLARLLLPDLFSPGFRRIGQYTRNLNDLDLALSILGETRLVKVKVETGAPPTLRVEATTVAQAIDHLADLGIEPVVQRG